MSFTVHKLSSRIGAVVEGVDLGADPAPALRVELRHLLNEHKALVIQNVTLDDPGQERVASWFGELTAAHPTVPAVSGTRNVLPVDSETSKANAWHSDVTFVVNPPQVTTLRSIVVTPYGGETLIANSAAAYRDLPESLRQLPTRYGQCTATSSTMPAPNLRQRLSGATTRPSCRRRSRPNTPSCGFIR